MVHISTASSRPCSRILISSYRYLRVLSFCGCTVRFERQHRRKFTYNNDSTLFVYSCIHILESSRTIRCGTHQVRHSRTTRRKRERREETNGDGRSHVACSRTLLHLQGTSKCPSEPIRGARNGVHQILRRDSEKVPQLCSQGCLFGSSYY